MWGSLFACRAHVVAGRAVARSALGGWWHLSSEWRKWCLHGRGSDLVVRECQKRSTLACTTRDQFQRHRSLPPRRAAPPWDKEARHSHAGLHRGKGKGKAKRQRQSCGLQRAAARRTTALPPPCTSIQRRQSGVGVTQDQGASTPLQSQVASNCRGIERGNVCTTWQCIRVCERARVWSPRLSARACARRVRGSIVIHLSVPAHDHAESHGGGTHTAHRRAARARSPRCHTASSTQARRLPPKRNLARPKGGRQSARPTQRGVRRRHGKGQSAGEKNLAAPQKKSQNFPPPTFILPTHKQATYE